MCIIWNFKYQTPNTFINCIQDDLLKCLHVDKLTSFQCVKMKQNEQIVALFKPVSESVKKIAIFFT